MTVSQGRAQTTLFDLEPRVMHIHFATLIAGEVGQQRNQSVWLWLIEIKLHCQPTSAS